MINTMPKLVGRRGAFAAVSAILISACATPAYQPNVPLSPSVQPVYAFRALAHPGNSDSLLVVMALSGGGYRAAAFGYAALEALSQTRVRWESEDKRLIDELDVLVGVSGGSLTA